MVIVLRGISGSGKSTASARYHPDFIVSADHFMVDASGAYAFDSNRLSECHRKCLLTFLSFVASHKEAVIVVDNTNTSLWEVSPYVQTAQALNHAVRVVTLRCDPLVAASRNVHDVPLSTIEAQHRALEASSQSMPSHWNHVIL